MKIDVLGVKVDSLTKTQLLKKISDRLGHTKSIFIVTPYSESIVSVQKNPEYRQILNSADFALPDGIGILWAANYLHTKRGLLTSLLSIIFNPKSVRHPIPEKIPGSEFVYALAELAESRGESIFILGGFDDTPEKAASKLKRKYPRLKIAGTYTGSPEEQGIVSGVNKHSPDYLLVAFGPIYQEKWLYKHRSELNVKLMVGLGGTFDYMVGKRPSAPKIWRLTGLEWLWRLITQPWRVKRVITGVLGLIYYCYRQKARYN